MHQNVWREWVNQGLEGVRLRATLQSPGSDPLAIWRKAADLGIAISVQGTLEEFGSPEFENVIKELPSLNIILEHLGGAGARYDYRLTMHTGRFWLWPNIQTPL